MAARFAGEEEREDREGVAAIRGGERAVARAQQSSAAGGGRADTVQAASRARSLSLNIFQAAAINAQIKPAIVKTFVG